MILLMILSMIEPSTGAQYVVVNDCLFLSTTVIVIIEHL